MVGEWRRLAVVGMNVCRDWQLSNTNRCFWQHTHLSTAAAAGFQRVGFMAQSSSLDKAFIGWPCRKGKKNCCSHGGTPAAKRLIAGPGRPEASILAPPGRGGTDCVGELSG